MLHTWNLYNIINQIYLFKKKKLKDGNEYGIIGGCWEYKPYLFTLAFNL